MYEIFFSRLDQKKIMHASFLRWTGLGEISEYFPYDAKDLKMPSSSAQKKARFMAGF